MSSKQDERRKEILAVALQAFNEKGYDKTSMDDVVRATGLSKGTIYWYFKNKQEMFTALMEFVVDQFFEEFDFMLSSTHDLTPRAALSMIFETVNAIVDMNPNSAALTIDFMLQALHYPDLRKKYAGYYARYIDELGAIIQRGIDEGTFRQIDAHAASASLIGLMDGIMLQALLKDEMNLDWQWQIKNILQVAETLVMNGIVKEVSDDG